MTIQQTLAGIARRVGIPIARVVEEHAERSAIREYLGGMSRAEAEQEAVNDTCDVFGITKEPSHG
jgi:hypothetical protein